MRLRREYMGKSSKIWKGLLATAMSVILMMTMLPWTALADPVIDPHKTGTLTIDLQYNGQKLSGGRFDLYRVADLDDTAALSFSLTGAFQQAGTRDGVDINAVKTAADVEKTASIMKKYVGSAQKAASVVTQDGEATAAGLPLGIYLVVQSETPADYSLAAPFLVYFPTVNSDGTGWVYDSTAAPKVTYEPPVKPLVQVQVVKEWDDAGFESVRPATVLAALYRNGALYQTQTLSADTGWQYTWSGLSADYTWTVGELDVSDTYFCLIAQDGSKWMLTNVRDNSVPLGTTLNVTKNWEGDSQQTRPASIVIDLMCDGKLYDSTTLTASDGWKHTWAGIDPAHSWSVTEPNVPDGYQSSVKTVSGGFVVTNTFVTTISDNEVPTGKAPQTGLLQWPIPVLCVTGALLVLLGVCMNRHRKKYEK